MVRKIKTLSDSHGERSEGEKKGHGNKNALAVQLKIRGWMRMMVEEKKKTSFWPPTDI